MSKSSIALRVFGLLILIGAVIFLLLSKINPDFRDMAILSLGAVSFLGVCFQMHYKEIIIRKN